MELGPSDIPHGDVMSGKRPLGAIGYLLVLGGVLAFLVFVAVAMYLMWAQAAGRRVESQLAELRADGQPTTAGELDAYYVKPPAGEDVTPLLIAAGRELESSAFAAAASDLPIVGPNEEEIPPPGQEWEKREAARQLLDAYSESLRHLHQAADRGAAARFPVRFEEGLLDMTLEHLQQLRNAARLLELEAHVRAHEGDAQGAANSIRALLSLPRSLENEPVFVSHLVAYSIISVGHGLVVELLPEVEFADQDLATLQRDLRLPNAAEGLRRGLVGERALGIDLMQHPEQLARSVGEIQVPVSLGPRDLDLSMYIETMNRIVAAAEEPWPEARKLDAEISKDVDAMLGQSPIAPMWYPISGLLLPSLSASVTAAARSDVTGKLVDTAIAVERYRRDQGQPPPTIAELVPTYLPAVPEDPFSGQPIRYVLSDREIVFYSIGRDGTDDGGQGDLSGEPDLVIRLPRR